MATWLVILIVVVVVVVVLCIPFITYFLSTIQAQAWLDTFKKLSTNKKQHEESKK